MILEFNMVKTMLLAIVLLYIGNGIRNRIEFLKRWWYTLKFLFDSVYY